MVTVFHPIGLPTGIKTLQLAAGDKTRIAAGTAAGQGKMEEARVRYWIDARGEQPFPARRKTNACHDGL